MSSFYIRDYCSELEQNNGEIKRFFDLSNPYDNKSRIPAHNLDDSFLSIAKVQNDLISASQSIYSDVSEKELLISAITVSIMISCFMKTSEAFKIAVIGKSNNFINYNIAELTGIFNPYSKLCLINDGCEDNDDGRAEFTEVLGNGTAISVLYTDYDDIIMSDDTFDITIINGETHFSDHYDVINEAIRITKQNGMLISLCMGDYLLESVFKLVLQGRNEYEISPDAVVLSAVKDENIWSAKDKMKISREVLEEMRQDSEKVRSSGDIDKMRNLVSKADKFADEAVKEHETELKKGFIALKEELLKSIVKEKKKM
ncbi:MAG: hypothetical protein IJ736_12590 [Firmicutes bacterium]|nr:hypothetical protein [Bacillota bacterium]